MRKKEKTYIQLKEKLTELNKQFKREENLVNKYDKLLSGNSPTKLHTKKLLTNTQKLLKKSKTEPTKIITMQYIQNLKKQTLNVQCMKQKAVYLTTQKWKRVLTLINFWEILQVISQKGRWKSENIYKHFACNLNTSFLYTCSYVGVFRVNRRKANNRC